MSRTDNQKENVMSMHLTEENPREAAAIAADALDVVDKLAAFEHYLHPNGERASKADVGRVSWAVQRLGRQVAELAQRLVMAECAHPAWLYASDGIVECPECGMVKPNPDDAG